MTYSCKSHKVHVGHLSMSHASANCVRVWSIDVVQACVYLSKKYEVSCFFELLVIGVSFHKSHALICWVLFRLNTGTHAADLQNFINIFTDLLGRTRI